jgi:N utilization substance protein B
MPSRHRSREQALQILYLWDMRRQPLEEIVESVYGSLADEETRLQPRPDPFAEELARGAIEEISELDRHILEHSEHWRLERMSVVDRNILRLAIHEMLRRDTPHPVVIDEALELARRFSSDQSVAFINGVLDAVRKSLVSHAGRS